MPTPEKNEEKGHYISRCIKMVIQEGTAKDEKQAAAICYSMWEKHTNEEILFDKYLSEGTYVRTVRDLQKFIKETIRKHPKLKADLIDLYQLCTGEIEDGSSETHEVELCMRDIKELIEKEK